LSGAHAALQRRIDPVLRPWLQWTASLHPMSVATTIPVCCATIGLALTWWAWPIFDTLLALQSGEIRTSAAGPVLDPALYTRAKIYSQLCATLTFVLLFAIWRWWPSLERRAEDHASVRRMRWVAIAVCLAIMIVAIAPRRVYFEKFEVVLYKNQPALVIGIRGDELLLLPVGNPGGRSHPRARRYSPEIAPADSGPRSRVGRQ